MSEQARPRREIGTSTRTSDSASGLRFEILGAIRVSRHGSQVNLGGPQQRAVLALLLIDRDNPVSTVHIADALWGERPPPGNAATIQTYVFHLREALEPDRPRGAPAQVLVSERGGYRLDTRNAAVDADEFEDQARTGIENARSGDHERAVPELDAALDLWRGEVLADVAELEPVGPIAARLNELRLAAIEARIDAQLALGRHGLAVGELEELTAANPLRERLHAQRMLALYRCGRQADALAAYRHLHQVLDAEVGVRPSPQLRELHQAILAHDPSLTDSLPVDPRTDRGAASPTVRTSTGRRPSRRRWVRLAPAAVAVIGVGVVVAVTATHRPHGSLNALPANGVGVIRPDGSLHDGVPVGQSPTAVAYGDGSVWVANGGANTVMRIDPRIHTVVREIVVGGNPVALAATDSDVWVVNANDGTVDRINTTVNRVVGEPIKVGNQPSAIAVGPSGVWVANTGDNTVQHIDPSSSAVAKAIGVGGGPDGVSAADADSVWVANGLDGTVTQLDPRTGLVRALIHVGAGPTGLTTAGGSVWVTNSLEQSVSRIDPTSTAVDTVADVGDGPTAPVSDGRFLWVAASHSGAVARIGLKSRDVRRFGVGAAPVALAPNDGAVYVAAQAFAAAAHFGGTLTAGDIHLPGRLYGIDPANLYYHWTMAAERFVYDGLVAYRAADGAAGYTVVPDLATRMPTMSQDGTTYTFTLRTRIRYSTGQFVQAQDFVRGFRRVFTVGGGGHPALLSGVVGAAHCLRDATTCNLSHGVIADDAHHRLTIRLTAPDADFLPKLTYFLVPTPAGTPARQLTRPLPGTGPYQIDPAHVRSTRHGRTTETVFDTLIRNPYFTQWSFAAQPRGYPDVIKFREYSTAGDAARAVRSGSADISRLSSENSANLTQVIADVKVHDPAHLYALTTPGLWWVALNTRVHPFDNVLARRAVNYAADRRQLTADTFGPGVVQPSCQLLPPNFPSFEWYCPYTRAGTQPYNGPDLAEARRLVAQSGTRGARVVVSGTIEGPADNTLLNDLARTLNAIGYHASTRALPPTIETDRMVYSPRNGLQVYGKDGWIADYRDPDAFYGSTVSCASRRTSAHGFCDKHLNDLAAAARRTALTDPSAAREQWRAIDKLVTDEAPWITLGPENFYQLTGPRVGNVQISPFNPLYDQLWVK
jgi:YVTN family beta-propeller protein